MSASDLEPLDPELAALVATEKKRPPPPDSARFRVEQRMQATLRAGAGGGPASGAGGGLAKAGLLKGLAIFVAGGAVGAGTHALVMRSPPGLTPVVVPRAPEPPPALPAAQAANPPASFTEVPAPSPLPAHTRVRPAFPVATVPPPPSADAGAPATETLSRDHALSAERALIEVARTALGRGRAGEALSAVERHAREFPNGQLAEERDALWIQALAESGRFPEARERANAFRERYPHSMLRPMIDAALENSP